jgi:single-strand DNA-binding protein
MSKRDTITVVGHVATDPLHSIVGNGLARTSFRLAVTQSRFDRTKNEWDNSESNWYTVTAFRNLALHVAQSVRKGERVIVSGNLRIREWRQDDRHGTAVDIDAEAIGHDLTFGTAVYTRTMKAGPVGSDGETSASAFDPDEARGRAVGGVDGDGWALPGVEPQTEDDGDADDDATGASGGVALALDDRIAVG